MTMPQITTALKPAVDPRDSLDALLDRLSFEIRCPVYRTSLGESCVSLAPCMHKVSREVARIMFGSTSQEIRTRRKGCPVCRRVVIMYYNDPQFRNIAKDVFAVHQKFVALKKVGVNPSISDESKEGKVEAKRKEPEDSGRLSRAGTSIASTTN